MKTTPRSLLIGILSVLALLKTYPQSNATEAKWRFALGGKTISKPAAQAESVVMLTDDGTLKAL
ncbi:MAG: hypothetical protein SNJ56_04480, partial [Termitinemataceae bacterium]